MFEFEGFDVIESDSAFHRAKLAQRDKGINPGRQKMRPVIFQRCQKVRDFSHWPGSIRREFFSRLANSRHTAGSAAQPSRPNCSGAGRMECD
jgi:hypothetical protein